MNNQQRALIESALELLHRVIGMDDAINDFATLQRGKFRIEDVHPAEQNAKMPPPERAGALFIGENRGIVTFTEKEILSMPKEKRNYFRANGLRVFYRKKKNGVFEIRCTINKVKGYRFYDLRHTFTTNLQENGADKRWIDYVTNHVAAQNVTDSVYTHWNDKFHLSQIELLQY